MEERLRECDPCMQTNQPDESRVLSLTHTVLLCLVVVSGIRVGVPHTRSLLSPSTQSRQFEYHPTQTLLGVGTIRGEVVVTDWNNGRQLGKMVLPGAIRQNAEPLGRQTDTPQTADTGQVDTSNPDADTCYVASLSSSLPLQF